MAIQTVKPIHRAAITHRMFCGIPRRRRAGALAGVALLLLATPATAKSIYAPWKNGPSQSPSFYPLAVWWQAPTLTGHSGSYPTVAAAVAGTKMNIFLGLGSWPEGFGTDAGELEAIKAENLYTIGGIATPYDEDTSAQSVASVLALARSIGALGNVIGYNAGDEPNCGPPDTMALVPSIIAGINSYDPTRVVNYNETAWMVDPPGWYSPTCWQQSLTALQATSIGSFDLYPLTGPWMPQSGYFPDSETKSDFISIPNDTLWAQGVTTQALIHDGRAAEPAWVYVEAGGDNLGFSSQNNNFPGGVASGSTTLTNVSGWSVFTPTWIGLAVSGAGIPAGTVITGIIDASHAEMSAAATATNAYQSITITGGAGGNTDCVAAENLCVVNGNEFRPTLAQVDAEVWMSLINGANGIEYFCDDSTSYSFCLGDQAGGAVATQTELNLQYINEKVLSYATALNSPVTGLCSMQQINYATGAFSTVSSCTNGILTMATANAAVPGAAMVRQLGNVNYVFAQSGRRSPAGATFTFVLAGLAGKTATVMWDSNQHYDSHHSSTGYTKLLDGTGQFHDILGANQDDYQVKIYRVE